MRPTRLCHRLLPVIVALLCAAAGVLLAIHFAQHQSLWFDEVSQMKGLTLGPGAVTQWLCGVDVHRFAVPPDRNPPLSYWAGHLWAGIWGYHEFGLRMLGVVYLLISTLILARIGWKMSGYLGMILASLSFALSPNVIENVVEIRSYGLWMMIASAAWFQLYVILAADKATPSRLGPLTVFCLLAGYTHFFGVVQSVCMFTVAAAHLLGQDRRTWKWIATWGVIYGVGSLGLVPFVHWAIEHVGGAEAELDPLTTRFSYSLPRMIYRLVGHPATAVHRIWLAALLMGHLLAAMLLLAAPRRSTTTAVAGKASTSTLPPHVVRRIGWAAGLTISLGLMCNIMGRLAVSSFDPLRSRYSLWMLPGVILLAVAGISTRRPVHRRFVPAVTYALLLAGVLGTSYVFGTHATVFSHGPQRLLEAMIDASHPRPIVAYEPSRIWGFGYVPMLFRYDRELAQFRVPSETMAAPSDRTPTDDDAPHLVQLDGPPIRTPLLELPRGSRVLVVQLLPWGQHEIRDHLLGSSAELRPGPVLRHLMATGNWRVIQTQKYYAYTTCYAALLEKTGSNAVLSNVHSGGGDYYHIDNTFEIRWADDVGGRPPRETAAAARQRTGGGARPAAPWGTGVREPSMGTAFALPYRFFPLRPLP